MEGTEQNAATEQQPEEFTLPEGFNEQEYLKTRFGVEDATVIKQRFEGYSNLENELNTIKPDYEKIKPEWEQLKQQPQPGEMTKWVSELESKGVTNWEDVIRFREVQPEKMDDRQAIVLASKLQNKGWEDRHAEANYQQSFVIDENDATVTEVQKTIIEANRIKAAEEAREFLKGYIGKVFNPAPAQDNTQQEQAVKAATEFWSANAPSVVSSLSKITGEASVKLPGGKGEVMEQVAYTYQIPDESLKAIQDYAIKAAVAQGVPNNEQGLKVVSDFIQKAIWNQHGPDITAAALQAQQTRFAEFIAREFNHVMPAGGGAGGGVVPSAEDRFTGGAYMKHVTGR